MSTTEKKSAVYAAVGNFTVLTDKGTACNFASGRCVTKNQAIIQFLDSQIESGGIDYITKVSAGQVEAETKASEELVKAQVAASKPSKTVTGIATSDDLKVKK